MNKNLSETFYMLYYIYTYSYCVQEWRICDRATKMLAATVLKSQAKQRL